MSYTPTTEEVRDKWASCVEEFGTSRGMHLDYDDALAAFDRWLAAHDAEVAARQIDAPSVREAIGEVLADMEATAEGTHIASSLALLQEITDAVIRAAVSPPSRTAKRTGYETVGHGVGEHSQKITARAAEYRKREERMSDYTPHPNEVRADFINLHTRNFDAYLAGRSLTSEQEVYGGMFDRMIAEVERAAAARALEEFAEEMSTGYNTDTLNAERRAIKREARARAAEIRGAKSDD